MRCLLLLSILAVAYAGDKPHIVHIVADDFGWDDVSWHNSDMITPNLQKLAEEGVILDNMYVQTSCSPTRSCLMSGFYSAHIGSQHLVYKPDKPHGLPTWLTTLPDVLKSEGYSTYGVGKWHLGYCNESYIPTNRGFDHFYGFYLGSVDYWSHRTSEKGPYGTGKYNGFDFRDDGEKVEGEGVDGVYSSVLFQKKLLSLITEHNPEDPMYMYVAFQLPHSPVTVPEKYAAMYDDRVTNEDRKIYSGQVTFMDEIIGDVRAALEDAGMWDDTFILFHSDNGGDIRHAASNFPLRGNKGTYFDGGIKAVAMAHGKGIKKTGYVNREMIHAVDVFPTFIEVAGGKIDFEIDGVSAWKTLSEGVRSDRTGFLITIDEDYPDQSFGAAIRVGPWKYMEGYPAFRYPEKALSWYKTPYHGDITKGPKLPQDPETTTVWLFNMEEDPTEMDNLADRHPEVVAMLAEEIEKYRQTTFTDFPPSSNMCDPALSGDWWSAGWCAV